MTVLRDTYRSFLAAVKTWVFILKVLPTLPSRPLNLVTPSPIVEELEYPTSWGVGRGDCYRPSRKGRHPGIVVCLGVVPFGVDHPQVPRLGEALARSGFAALLYWSPAMRDFRLDPEDIESIALAYDRLLDQPYVDSLRSGIMGTCVGGSFALMASAHSLIRDRVSFVAAFAPYSSLLTLGPDIASSSCVWASKRESWVVDPLTRKVFVHSVTAKLESGEAESIRAAFQGELAPREPATLSLDGHAVFEFLAAKDVATAEAAMNGLPQEIRDGLQRLSPLNYAGDLRADLIAISHDRDDTVIPVGESRRLRDALGGSRGVQYTEFAMFQHADPTKRKLSPPQLIWQLGRLYGWLYSVFRRAAG